MSLTPKQEAFALTFFETGNAAEAYRRSYDVSENAKDQWIYVEACQLLDNPKITLRLQELREHAERHSIYTRQQALDEYETARQLAFKTGNPSAVVSAVNGKVKLFGLEAPVKAKVDHTSSDGSMTPKPTTIRIVAADDGSNDTVAAETGADIQ
ncbi:terminase small subunit [Ochrobactrum sp. Marseille-Q0166]|uniref:terminase small subunit n=1 Tax=Ochrobactrum sp. Marseille-Q0166 TaxID=2761105 RepID=UPI001655B103|nr:terminase small subunit [Ochrobactrum sp. Marseille-Q0166]